MDNLFNYKVTDVQTLLNVNGSFEFVNCRKEGTGIRVLNAKE